MPIDGLIILDETGRPIIQTNFRNTSTAYPLLHVDAFNDALAKSYPTQIDPILYVMSHNGPSACCHISCGGLRILAPLSTDMDPLFVFSFLQRFVDVLQDYFGEVSALVLKDNFDVVYQVLEEMVDDGYPLTTELSALRDIVLPPSFVNKILSVAGVAGLAKASATPFSSPIPWRKTGLKYNNNEIYFDIVEELDAVVSKTGTVVSSTVWGKVKSNCRLSGTPDLLLSFINAQVITDCSFHPCVRLQKWTRDKILSFVPPDRYFTLLEYRFAPAAGIAAAQPVAPPFTMKPEVRLIENGGELSLTLTSRTSGKPIGTTSVELYLGSGATGASCTVSSGCTWGYDPSKLLLRWEIPSMTPLSTHTLRGSFTSMAVHPRPSRALTATFEIKQHSFSTLKVDQLKVSGEVYKPYKGVRGQARGTVEFRW
ncbi:clathrin adaptor, mu subunit [Hysterangium stoloniferum]|nr:clathrin adaptor, mu subunit [Hysterangium stoloniferum]